MVECLSLQKSLLKLNPSCNCIGRWLSHERSCLTDGVSRLRGGLRGASSSPPPPISSTRCAVLTSLFYLEMLLRDSILESVAKTSTHQTGNQLVPWRWTYSFLNCEKQISVPRCFVIVCWRDWGKHKAPLPWQNRMTFWEPCPYYIGDWFSPMESTSLLPSILPSFHSCLLSFQWWLLSSSPCVWQAQTHSNIYIASSNINFRWTWHIVVSTRIFLVSTQSDSATAYWTGR